MYRPTFPEPTETSSRLRVYSNRVAGLKSIRPTPLRSSLCCAGMMRRNSLKPLTEGVLASRLNLSSPRARPERYFLCRYSHGAVILVKSSQPSTKARQSSYRRSCLSAVRHYWFLFFGRLGKEYDSELPRRACRYPSALLQPRTHSLIKKEQDMP